MRSAVYSVARLESLTDGAAMLADVPGETGTCLLVRLGDEVFALSERCPHQGASLAGAPVSASGELVCRQHGYRFDVRSGECLTLGGYALKRYPVRIDNGTVYVTVWEFD